MAKRHPPRGSKPATFTPDDATGAKAGFLDLIQGMNKFPKNVEKALEQGGRQLIGNAVSAAQSIASQAGPAGSALGSVLEGARSGGAAGAGLAAAQQAAQFAFGFEGAGRDAQLNAPLFSGRGRGEFERQFGKTEFLNDARRGLERFNDVNEDTGGLLGKLAPGLEILGNKFGQDATEDTRRSRELHEHRTRPIDRTAREVGEFAGEIAALGGTVTDDQIRSLTETRLRQNRARQATAERVEKITNVIGGHEGYQHGAGSGH